jgi:DME family drug/metabolite transporter
LCIVWNCGTIVDVHARLQQVQILLAAVLFGTTGTAQALGPTAPPLAVGAARVAVGGALLAALAAWRGELGGLRPVAPLLLVGGAGVALYQVSFFAAVRDTGVAVGTVVAIGAAPIAAGLLEWCVDGRRPGPRWLCATLLAASGVGLLTLTAGGGSSSLSLPGIGLSLVAAFGYASYAVLSRRLLRLGHAPGGVMGAAFGIGAVVLLPVLLASDTRWLATRSGAGLALYLGVLPTAGAYLLYARGLRRVSAAEAATIGLAEPVTAAILSALLLGERLSAPGLVGGCLVLAGLAALVVRRPQRLSLAAVPSRG